MIMAIDAGHGYTKGLSHRGTQVLFPSLIAPAPSALDLGSFGHTALTVIDGQAFVVGEAARPWATPLWTRDKALDDDTLRLMLVAAAELGANGPVRLATGLPLAWFGSQHAAFRQALHGAGGRIQRPDGTVTQLWFESVVILPQGVAAAGPILDRMVSAPGPYIVVDVGYRTTDYILVTKGTDGRLTFDPTAAGSLELGMHTVYAAVANCLSQQHRTVFTVAHVAQTDSVVIRGQRISIVDDCAREEHRLARSIVRALTERLDAQLDQVLGLIAVGGGSSVLVHAIPGILSPDHPQWANVQGYWAALADNKTEQTG